MAEEKNTDSHASGDGGKIADGHCSPAKNEAGTKFFLTQFFKSSQNNCVKKYIKYDLIIVWCGTN